MTLEWAPRRIGKGRQFVFLESYIPKTMDVKCLDMYGREVYGHKAIGITANYGEKDD